MIEQERPITGQIFDRQTTINPASASRSRDNLNLIDSPSVPAHRFVMKTSQLWFLFLALGVCASAAESSLDELRVKARNGDAQAQFQLGLAYEGGELAAKDLAQSAFWFRNAAEQGVIDAQARLGVFLAAGLGVEIDYEEAIQWLVPAAKAGYPMAQEKLGFLYAMGQGVPYDQAKALEWFRQVCSDERRAELYPGLLYTVGVNYSYGIKTDPDDARAYEWFTLAAQLNDPGALYEVGRAYFRGRGVAEDKVEAAVWLKKAALRESNAAQHLLGLMYGTGMGVPKDEIEGLAWINIAAAQGKESHVRDQRILEEQVAREGRLQAQQRTREILKEIEQARASAAEVGQSGAAANRE